MEPKRPITKQQGIPKLDPQVMQQIANALYRPAQEQAFNNYTNNMDWAQASMLQNAAPEFRQQAFDQFAYAPVNQQSMPQRNPDVNWAAYGKMQQNAAPPLASNRVNPYLKDIQPTQYNFPGMNNKGGV